MILQKMTRFNGESSLCAVENISDQTPMKYAILHALTTSIEKGINIDDMYIEIETEKFRIHVASEIKGIIMESSRWDL